MFALLRFLFLAAIGLIVLIPLGIVLAAVGLPIAAVLGLLALPVLLVLFLVGLPILIIVSVALGLIGATFGILMAFLSVGVVAIKIAFIVLVPLLVLGWIVRRVASPRDQLGIR
jgi:hypothetical protein